ncbi:4-aminobutyrate--2-oxoglutarate transaminase OS=Streptomyces tendae OX=1932 GN=gabT PE=3 SV=1 [Streptomyces tendae]
MTALPQERRVVTAIPGPKSQELQARRTAVVAQGVGSTLPVFVARAGGGVIEDVDGNRLIDFGSGIAVTSVGASAEAVVRKASAQLADFTHTCFMVTPYEGYVAVAEALAEPTPGDHAKKSALFNSGAEAVENAVKIARAYTRRQAVVVFDHGYHGRTNLTMALTAKNMPYQARLRPVRARGVPRAGRLRLPLADRCRERRPEAAAQAIRPGRARGLSPLAVPCRSYGRHGR